MREGGKRELEEGRNRRRTGDEEEMKGRKGEAGKEWRRGREEERQGKGGNEGREEGRKVGR